MPNELSLEGIVVIVGNYGSGKSEVSINLAVNRKLTGIDVKIADLDLVNPYFRIREAKELFSDLGIDMILPPEEYLQADLPIVSRGLAGIIENPGQLTIIDCGGDDTGAVVLGSIIDLFEGYNAQMLQVVNPFRPFTETIEGCQKIRKEIEAVAKMQVNGIIGNANRIEETVADDVYFGYDFAEKLSKESGLPLEFVTVSKTLLSEIDLSRFSVPILPIQRRLILPWSTGAGSTVADII